MANTLRTKYCAHHAIPADDFVERVFWATIPSRKRPFARLVNLVYPKYFELDRRAIWNCGRAESLAALETELSGFFSDAYKWGYLRRKARLRVSAKKLRRLAAKHLPETKAGGKQAA